MTAANDSDNPPQGLDRRSLVLRLAWLPIVIALLMFLPAGTWAWTRGWLFVLVLLGVISAVFFVLNRVNPEVIVARSKFHEGTKGWDKIMLSLYFPAMAAVLFVAALDDGRYLTDSEGFLNSASHLIVDRDASFRPLRKFLDEQTETEVILLSPKSPNLNAYLERFMRSLKSECLDRMIFFGSKSLEHALKEYVAHYHSERNHQGLHNKLIDPGQEVDGTIGKIKCRDRLGGLLNYYYRDAA